MCLCFSIKSENLTCNFVIACQNQKVVLNNSKNKLNCLLRNK